MSGFSAKANELLVEIYRNVQILEQNELKKQRLNISINEMHMIELIAKGKTGMTVSEIAQQLKVTKPSVTVAVNKLVQKGYCEKQRLPGDGRAVQVMLTPEGKKVEAFHRRCHRRIIAEICEDLSEEEREELLTGKVCTAPDGERWTLRKLLRRFLWHDRIHARAMWRTAAPLWGSAVADPFGFR